MNMVVHEPTIKKPTNPKACEEVGRNASKAADAIMRGAGF